MFTFSTPYKRDFKKMTKVIQRYWPILYQDPQVENILKLVVRYVARRGRSLGNMLLPSVFYTTKQGIWLSTQVCYRCGNVRCSICQYIVQSLFHHTPQIAIKTLVNFSSTHMIYLIYYTSCCTQYVGCTTRALRTRINEHIYAIKIDTFGMHTISSTSIYFLETHAGDLTSFRVTAIRKVIKTLEGIGPDASLWGRRAG